MTITRPFSLARVRSSAALNCRGGRLNWLVDVREWDGCLGCRTSFFFFFPVTGPTDRSFSRRRRLALAFSSPCELRNPSYPVELCGAFLLSDSRGSPLGEVVDETHHDLHAPGLLFIRAALSPEVLDLSGSCGCRSSPVAWIFLWLEHPPGPPVSLSSPSPHPLCSIETDVEPLRLADVMCSSFHSVMWGILGYAR